MTSAEKITFLKDRIRSILCSVIQSDYVLWGLPYYLNIGDTLIWQGEVDFLKTLPYKNKGVCPWNAYPGSYLSPNKVSLEKSTTILITGGGYFGDTWRNGWEYVLDAIQLYPENPIVFLPQTIYYSDSKIMESDKKILSLLKNLTICVRDSVSYEYAQTNFSACAKIVLVPDMAFYISIPSFQKWIKPTTQKRLYLKRLDKESIGKSVVEDDINYEIRDWPTIEPGFRKTSFLFYDRIIRYRNFFARKIPFLDSILSRIADYILYHYFRGDMLKIGIGFVSQYSLIRTTRLHVMILSILLGKDVVCEDNSYGKLSSFYNTWLTDLDSVTIEKN